MKNRFDMEQEIMACWNVTNDIDVLLEAIREKEPTTDQIANTLLGMQQLYQFKFERLFKTFDQLVQDREF